MKRSVVTTLLTAAMLSCGFNVQAIIAKRGVRTIVQPDGTELRVQLTGDENHHYYTTEDGYLLLDRDDVFYYGEIDAATGLVVNSQVRAANKENRDEKAMKLLSKIDREATVKAFSKELAEKAPVRGIKARAKVPAKGKTNGDGIPAEGYPKGPGQFPGTAFPSYGSPKVLVVLVQYTDVSFNLPDPYDYFHRMLTEEGFSDERATGSARDFFVKSSSGIFTPEFDVYGPLTLAHNRSYYGGNIGGSDQRPEEMAIEACQQLDATVDFSQYDCDGDGYIDNIYIFYAGQGEADGGAASTVWPHSWEITSATSTPYYFDGVRLDRYACSNEWTGNSYTGYPDGIGTFCHEFSHVMGLPDEYATNYSGAFTPGAWSVMDYGPYNNDSRTPPIYSAFQRYAMGWIDPIEITGPLNGSMGHILDSNKAYIVKTSSENEYFLFENRQKAGNDLYIPGHGMLVWHIDYSSSVWNNNSPNNTSNHQRIDIEEADGSRDESSRAGDAFPGTSRKTSFTDTTSPSMKTWSNKALNLPITDIAEVDGVITFKACGGVLHVDPTVVNEIGGADVTAHTVSVSWTPVEGATDYLVTIKDKAGVAVYDEYSVGNVTSFTFTGLEPLTAYDLYVVTENSGAVSDPSNVVEFTTSAPGFDERGIELAEPTDVVSDGFTLNWVENPEAVEYFVNIYTKEGRESQTDGYDFTDKVSGMPSGWSTNASSTYSGADYAGKAAPSLKLSSDKAYIQTAVYDSDITSLKFWHRGAASQPTNYLTLYGLVNGSWKELAKFNINNVAGGVTYEYTEFPEGACSAKLVFTKASTGNVAIDDIEVVYGGGSEIVPVDGYVDRSVGAETSVVVQGMQPATTYYYTVHASNGTLLSLKSDEGSVTTTQVTGIEMTTSEKAEISLNGKLVEVNAPRGTIVTVSDVAGRVVKTATVGAGAIRFALPGSGLYIVRAGNKVAKIAVR